MTAAFTHARWSAPAAAVPPPANLRQPCRFLLATGLMRAVIFIAAEDFLTETIQALDHGALTVQMPGDFDDAMQRVQQVGAARIYLVNSGQSFRLEAEDDHVPDSGGLRWDVPDWIVVPAGT